jgi:hypothetical protein
MINKILDMKKIIAIYLFLGLISLSNTYSQSLKLTNNIQYSNIGDLVVSSNQLTLEANFCKSKPFFSKLKSL